MRRILPCLLLAGCPIDTQYVDTDSVPHPLENSLGSDPLVTIEGPNRANGEVTFYGLVADADQPLVTLLLELESSEDGLLWRGNPLGNGTWSWTGYLTLVEHEITVRVEDADGNRAEASRVVKMGASGNRSPLCVITSPTPGASFLVGDTVSLVADVSDPEGDALTVTWSSSLDGILGEGAAIETFALSSGDHVLSVEVTDGVSTPCIDDVAVSVDEE